MKNIVVCCDGTANEFAVDKTNVVKLCGILASDPSQIVYYHPGLGTMEPPGALTGLARRVTRLLGRAFGYGLEADIRDAYRFVMKVYEPGDRLFLFGFSRGAYTIRAVASLLKMYGLLPRDNDALVPYAIRLLVEVNRRRGGGRGDSFRLAEEFRQTFIRQDCPIHFVGVWDTVSSVGWIGNPLRLPYTAVNDDIAVGRHAIAIDERRAFFRTNLWASPKPGARGGPADVKQVWFAGVHCDVGGGYPEPHSGLSKLSLGWMIEEAAAHGLLIDQDKLAVVLGRCGRFGIAPECPDARMHQSLKGLWWIAEIIPKRSPRDHGWRLNFARRRNVPPGSYVHWSVFERSDYTPRLPSDVVRVERSVPVARE